MPLGAFKINSLAKIVAAPQATYSLTPVSNNVNEGSNLQFNVTTTNVVNGTTLYWTVSAASDFSTSSGSFTITSNAGNFTVTPTADVTTEGSESFTASVRTGSTSGTIVATSSSVTINDTSISREAKTIYRFGNTQTSTAQYIVGTASAYFDGNGDYLQLDNHADFNLQQTNFTLELWFRATVPGNTDFIMEKRNASNSGWALFTGSGNIQFQAYSAGSVLFGLSTPISDATWYHFAVVKQGTTIKIYLGGTLQETITNKEFVPNTDSIAIGRYLGFTSFDYLGFVDEIRLSDVARYTSNFTPSTTAFSKDANTLFLLHCDGANGGTTFADDV